MVKVAVLTTTNICIHQQKTGDNPLVRCQTSSHNWLLALSSERKVVYRYKRSMFSYIAISIQQWHSSAWLQDRCLLQTVAQSPHPLRTESAHRPRRPQAANKLIQEMHTISIETSKASKQNKRSVLKTWTHAVIFAALINNTSTESI
jgi:hypothetical protein